MALRERQLLVDRTERRLLAFARSRVPLVQVEGGGDAALQRQAVVEVADELHAAFAPSARDDCGLDEVALDAVIRGRFVVFVEQADRHQEQAGPHRPGRRELAFDIGLLDFDFTGVARRRHRVFDLEFGDNLGLRIEAVLEAEHEAAHVGLCVFVRAGRAVVVELAVAGEHGGGGGGCRRHRRGNRGRGGGYRRCGRRGRHCCGALLLNLHELRLHGGEFGGELVELAGQFGLDGGLRESVARSECETRDQARGHQGLRGQGAQALGCHGAFRGLCDEGDEGRDGQRR